MAEHFNSQGERITIDRASAGAFEGQPLLVIHDDPHPAGTGVAAPMLLDAGTRRWLRRQIDELDAEEAAARAREVGPHGSDHRRVPSCAWPVSRCVCDDPEGGS
jgi:hypothetical protein